MHQAGGPSQTDGRAGSGSRAGTHTGRGGPVLRPPVLTLTGAAHAPAVLSAPTHAFRPDTGNLRQPSTKSPPTTWTNESLSEGSG